jgi:CDP-diacylglycerol--inositol 3-phosphatidyltransferase
LWYYYNDSVSDPPALMQQHISDIVAFSQRTLFVFCAGNEIFFVCLYLMAFYTKPLGIDPLYVFLPLGRVNAQSILAHAIVHPLSWQAAIVRLIEGLTWPQLLGAVTFPICAVKQMINAIQFWKAAKALVELDASERRKTKRR